MIILTPQYRFILVSLWLHSQYKELMPSPSGVEW